MTNNFSYCPSLTKYSRRKTCTVHIGGIPVGSEHPIRVQSMTTTNTMDTNGTVAQSIRMIEAGSEFVRITAPSIKEAENLQNIKDKLRSRGYTTPLIADIHFTPNAAETSARIVEKVRINPGNYADRKKFQVMEYTDTEYNAELERIYDKFSPLVKICKENGTALRIGTNHGSLSDRIMNRYGDTPEGMVESAMEFLRICEDFNYHEIILSMKASNPVVMVQANRLLVNRMDAENMNYPLHLGVTEAGEGEDGRIKSAVGIGTLMEDGLGDTIRVSLTEEPEFEIPVAREMVNRYDSRSSHEPIQEICLNSVNPFAYNKRTTISALNIGGDNVPVVVADLCQKDKITPESLADFGYQYSASLDKWTIQDTACDYIFTGNQVVDFELPGALGVIVNFSVWKDITERNDHFPFLTVQEFLSHELLSDRLNIVYATYSDVTVSLIQELKSNSTAVLLIDTYNIHGMAEQRQIFLKLMEQMCETPIIIGRAHGGLTEEQFQLYSATDLGALLVDGLGDGIFIAAENCGADKSVNHTAFGILQAARTRIFKTEYISCPSCGRTLFDLQETTAKVRVKTNHLKGVKIAVMGCIVNGPGEMADADYGYVGTGVEKISLYRGKDVVKRNVPSEMAVDELIRLIKKDGNWVESDINSTELSPELILE